MPRFSSALPVRDPFQLHFICFSAPAATSSPQLRLLLDPLLSYIDPRPPPGALRHFPRSHHPGTPALIMFSHYFHIDDKGQSKILFSPSEDPQRPPYREHLFLQPPPLSAVGSSVIVSSPFAQRPDDGKRMRFILSEVIIASLGRLRLLQLSTILTKRRTRRRQMGRQGRERRNLNREGGG